MTIDLRRDVKGHSGDRGKHSRGARSKKIFLILLFQMVLPGALYFFSDGGSPKRRAARRKLPLFLLFSTGLDLRLRFKRVNKPEKIAMRP